MSRVLVITLTLILSIKLPQSMQFILQIMGAVIGTTIVILYPILIFNKAFRGTGKF